MEANKRIKERKQIHQSNQENNKKKNENTGIYNMDTKDTKDMDTKNINETNNGTNLNNQRKKGNKLFISALSIILLIESSKDKSNNCKFYSTNCTLWILLASICKILLWLASELTKCSTDWCWKWIWLHLRCLFVDLY